MNRKRRSSIKTMTLALLVAAVAQTSLSACGSMSNSNTQGDTLQAVPTNQWPQGTQPGNPNQLQGPELAELARAYRGTLSRRVYDSRQGEYVTLQQGFSLTIRNDLSVDFGSSGNAANLSFQAPLTVTVNRFQTQTLLMYRLMTPALSVRKQNGSTDRISLLIDLRYSATPQGWAYSPSQSQAVFMDCGFSGSGACSQSAYTEIQLSSLAR